MKFRVCYRLVETGNKRWYAMEYRTFDSAKESAAHMDRQPNVYLKVWIEYSFYAEDSVDGPRWRKAPR